MKKIGLIILAIGLAYGCGSKEENKAAEVKPKTKEELNAEIAMFEKKLYSDTANAFDKSSAYAVVKAYTEYADTYPDDARTPEYLFKAGEVSMGLNESIEAINLFKRLESYPSYEKAPYGLFLQAFVYDNHLNDDKRAEEIYKRFIEKYPQHPLTKDAQYSLENLGKSDEELIKEFEEKQKKKKNV